MKKIFKNYDKDFWGNISLNDLEEVDTHVRYCFAIYEPIN